MSEFPVQFVAKDPRGAEPAPENGLDPRLAQARLQVQTIQRFQALDINIEIIADPKERTAAFAKLHALAKNEYGKAWEILRYPDVEVIPMMIGGKTKAELKAALLANGYRIQRFAERIIDSPNFVTLEEPEPIVLVQLPVADLGFGYAPTTNQLYARARELGLELCPPEVGPHYRLQTSVQRLDEPVYISMPPLLGAGDSLDVFVVEEDDAGRWLARGFANPDDVWELATECVFRLPALDSSTR